MRDNLKDHITSNREEFEAFPFDSEKGWAEIADKIGENTEKKRPYKTRWIMAIASCIVLLLLSVFVFITPSGPSAVENEVAEMESYYNGEINHKIKLVRQQIDDDKILEDLTAMDAAFAELKADLSENVDNEEVILAMMENYRLKLKILEEILKELEKEKGEIKL